MIRSYIRRKIPHKCLRRLFYLTIGLIVYSAIAIPTTLSIINDNVLDYNQLTTPQQFNNNYFIKINLSIQEQDLSKKTIKYFLEFEPYKIKSEEGLQQIWDKNITFNFFPTSYSVKESSLIETFGFQSNFIGGGNLKNYPFDIYKTQLGFQAINNTTLEAIPLEIVAHTGTISTQNEFIIKNLEDGKGRNYTYFDIKIYRSSIVIIGSLLICSFVWTLTILMIMLAYDAVVYHREYPAAVMSLGIAILFALPAIRNTLPGVPDYGCALDYLCFFWADLIISLSSCTIIGCFTLRWKPQTLN